MNVPYHRAAGTYFDPGYAGYYRRHANRDEELVRASVDLFKNVLTADVGVG
ncbi:hypothetical protein RBB78_21360 [Tunturiibacter empetritectus]|uniref:hypothetical protein n=1 Tax=Tunturiibacter empetritectus TaxID=3069691 RepID=UPI003D9B4243